MIEVELPDGTIAEFPDGTSQEVMKQALQKRFGAPQAPQAPQSPEMQAGLAEMSAMTQNPAKARYDALPAWQKPLVAASDVLQLTANGATMGFGDKAVAAARAPFTGKSYDEELAQARTQTQGARRRAGGAGIAAEITGAVATPMALASKGATLAGRFGTGAMTGVPGLVTRSAMMGGEGAGYGMLTAAGNDQDIATGGLAGLAGGAAGNVLGEGIAAGVGKVAGMFNKAPPKIGVDDLKASGKAAYKDAADAGVIFNQNGIQRLGKNIEDDLAKHGFDPINEPGIAPVLSRIEKMQGGNVTLEGLDTLRKVAQNGYRPGMRSNNALVGRVIERIDELVNAADQSTLASVKDPKAAANALMKARSYWHRARKLETVEGLVDRGKLLGETNKSQNIEQTTRRQLRSLLTSESKGRGFSKAEKDAARKVVMGTPGQRVLDAASGMLPTGRLSGMVQGSIGAANMATGNLPGLALQGVGMAAGYGAHKASEALARKSVREFVDLVARGGVPAPVVQNALQRLAASKREAITRSLMALGVSINSRAQQPAQ